MWERIVLAVALKLLEMFFKRINEEQDEKKRLEYSEKVGSAVASAVMSFQKKYKA